MSCIRVPKIIDYLCEPLHRTLHDESPYVRKTAVICVAKLFGINQELVDENGFLDTLQSMLTDSNPMVLSNVVSALADIHSQAPQLNALSIDERIASKLMGCIGDCSEWGQVAILDALSEYRPSGAEQVEFFIDSILPRLQHVNPSIVLSAVKVLIVYSSYLPQGHEYVDLVKRKLAPPIVTLLSSPPEIQYVALRSIRLLLQKYPDIMHQGIRVFFCKYNDPLYIKTEKLQLILLLANESNIDQVYPELADYAKEVDIEFVRKAVKCIADLTCKIPGSANKSAELLMELAKSDARHVVQEVLIAARNVISNFPGTPFVRIIPHLYRESSFYDESESRAALIWLIGEQIDLIPDGYVVLSEILENFKLESVAVQSELFTAILKLYLKNPDGMRSVICNLIEIAKNSIESAEFRDRAFFYERLIDLDPRMIRGISLSGAIADINLNQVEPRLLEQLIKQLGSLSSVYYRLPEEFTSPPMEEPIAEESSFLESPLDERLQQGAGETIIHPQFHDLLDLGPEPSNQAETEHRPSLASSQSPSNLLDLLS